MEPEKTEAPLHTSMGGSVFRIIGVAIFLASAVYGLAKSVHTGNWLWMNCALVGLLICLGLFGFAQLSDAIVTSARETEETNRLLRQMVRESRKNPD